MKLAGVLLAAGSSTRFGADKLLHPLGDGMPLALASARTLRAAVPWVVAVVRQDNGELADLVRGEGLATVVCSDADQGMGASIACGVAATRDADGWLIALADMPCIRTETIARVAAALARGATLAAPALRGVRGHPVGLSRRYLAPLLALRGDTGARVILAQHAADLVLVDCDDEGIVRDIDRPHDVGPGDELGTLEKQKYLTHCFHAGADAGLISKPRAAARRLRAAILRWRCCSS